MVAAPEQTRRSARILDDLWYTGSSAVLTIVLLVLLAVTLAVALILPQQPAGLEGSAAERWLATMAAGYRGFGPFLRTAGLFDVLGGLWLRILLGVLAFNLALRLADQIQLIARAQRDQPADPGPPPGAFRQEIALAGPSDAVLPLLQEALNRRYRPVVAADDGTHLYAERRRYGLFGPLLLFLGPLLLLAGLLINGMAGWRAADVALVPGSSQPLGQGTGFEVKLEGITGTEPHTASRVTVAQTGGAGKTAGIAPLRPARWGNLWIIQRATGPALAVTARDSRGRALIIQSLGTDGQVAERLVVPFRPTQTEQGFAVPTRSLVFRAVSYPSLPERGIDRPVFLVEAYRGDAAVPILSALVEDKATLRLPDGDTVFELSRDHYATLEAAYLPGGLLLLLGGLLILGGLVLTSCCGYVRAWVDLSREGDGANVQVSVAAPIRARAEAVGLIQLVQRLHGSNV
jgi:hypothetical protein